jgi:hypothetical protein
MNNEMQRRALAARDAHEALLYLKKFVEEAALTTHSVELEAVHLAMSSSKTSDIPSKLRSVLERLASSDCEATFLGESRVTMQQRFGGRLRVIMV